MVPSGFVLPSVDAEGADLGLGKEAVPVLRHDAIGDVPQRLGHQPREGEQPAPPPAQARPPMGMAPGMPIGRVPMRGPMPAGGAAMPMGGPMPPGGTPIMMMEKGVTGVQSPNSTGRDSQLSGGRRKTKQRGEEDSPEVKAQKQIEQAMRQAEDPMGNQPKSNLS